jgi:hypothetical protein
MINKVLYMVNSDQEGKFGLIFPSETANFDYKIGQWFIAVERGDVKDEYQFDVVQNEILSTEILRRIKNNFYQVRGKDGYTYFFRIEHRRYWSDKYVGLSRILNPNHILYEVQPIDKDILSEAANKRKYFFVGSVDQEIMQKQGTNNF